MNAGRIRGARLAIGALGIAVALSTSVSFAQCSGGMGRGGMGGSMGSQNGGMSMAVMGGGMRHGGGGQMMGSQGMGMMNRTMSGGNFSMTPSNPFGQQVMQSQMAARVRVMQSQVQLAARHQRQTDALRQQSQSKSTATRTARIDQRPTRATSQSFNSAAGS